MEAAVVKRYSVRNYSERELEPGIREQIEGLIDSLDNPFGIDVNYHYLHTDGSNNETKLGTYGVIKGARHYVGATIKDEPLALEALGYELEAAMLFMAHLGVGTCWLGGTFDRKEFTKALKIGENELFPAMTPYGYPAEKKHVKEILMRQAIQADQRKTGELLFFKDDFEHPLPKGEMGDLAFPLEMVRLGPSASNKQPWRILVEGNDCHFYEAQEPGYSSRFPYDIQRIDLGIAAAHFDFAVSEKQLKGHFETDREPGTEVPEHMVYVFSWIRENNRETDK